MALKDLDINTNAYCRYDIVARCSIIVLFIACCILNFSYGLCSDEKGSVTNLPLPRFISLKANEVNLRSGPASNYPIKLNYMCKHYPLQVIAEFDNWRMLQDVDGSQGWAHSSLIAGQRYAMVIDNTVSSILPYTILSGEAILFKTPKEESYPVARLEIGTIVALKRCDELWCQVKVDSYQGWIQKINLWGVQNDELLAK